MTNIVVHGKSGIRVEVVLHSISEAGKEIITFLRDYPRIVHAEDLKHRMFSNSAASSRAIPAAKMAKQLTGMPVSFGKNQSGMQAGEEHSEPVKGRQVLDPDTGLLRDTWYTPQDAWSMAKEDACFWANAFTEAGYHKQVANRRTEADQMIRVLTTATELDNFYWLRDDPAADPTIQEVARCMREAHKQSVPQVLKAGEWHLPFVDVIYREAVSGETKQLFFEDSGSMDVLELQDAIKVSCARCAATSFRNTDYNLEKSLQVYDRLANGDKVHAGALEHCATPIEFPQGVSECRGSCYGFSNEDWEEGVSHMDREGNLWSGNFKAWIQYRKLVPNECFEK